MYESSKYFSYCYNYFPVFFFVAFVTLAWKNQFTEEKIVIHIILSTFLYFDLLVTSSLRPHLTKNPHQKKTNKQKNKKNKTKQKTTTTKNFVREAKSNLTISLCFVTFILCYLYYIRLYYNIYILCILYYIIY